MRTWIVIHMLLLATMAVAEEPPHSAPATAPASQPMTQPAAALPDPDQLIALLREHEKENQDLLQHYAFTQYEEGESYDAEGRVKQRRARKTRVIPQKEGPPDMKLLEVDGRAPTAKELEQFEKDRRQMLERQEKARARRGKKEQGGSGEEGEEEDGNLTLLDLLKGPRYEVAGWEEMEGRRAVRVEIYPDVEKKVSGAAMRVARTARGTAWVDPDAGQVLRAEAHTTRPTKVGAGLAAVKEFRFVFVNQLVRGELWFPREMTFEGSFRILLKKERMKERVVFSDFVKAVTEVETQYEWPGGDGGSRPQSGTVAAPSGPP